MIPANAREGDFVEVTAKNNNYFGMIGRIKKLRTNHATIDIYGKIVDIPLEELTLRARTGTGRHDALKEQVNSRKCNNLDGIGYDALINFAIDIKDWEWAQSLVERKNKLKNKH